MQNLWCSRFHVNCLMHQIFSWIFHLIGMGACEGTQAAGLRKIERICAHSQAGRRVPQWSPKPLWNGTTMRTIQVWNNQLSPLQCSNSSSHHSSSHSPPPHQSSGQSSAVLGRLQLGDSGAHGLPAKK